MPSQHCWLHSGWCWYNAIVGFIARYLSNFWVSGRVGELRQTVNLLPLGWVGSNPTLPTTTWRMIYDTTRSSYRSKEHHDCLGALVWFGHHSRLDGSGNPPLDNSWLNNHEMRYVLEHRPMQYQQDWWAVIDKKTGQLMLLTKNKQFRLEKLAWLESKNTGD